MDLEVKIQSSNEKFHINLVINWLIQIADAINFLHTKEPKPIIHRDIKPKNIFITFQGLLKLGDFGVSKYSQNLVESEQTFVGTDGYKAPEIILWKNYNKSIDIWAFACVIYMCIEKEKAFPPEKLKQLISLYSRKDQSDYIPKLSLSDKKLNQLYQK